MEADASVEGSIGYWKALAGAGWAGIASARRGAGRARATSWEPVALAAGIGMLAAGLLAKGRAGARVAAGLAGGLVAGGATAAFRALISPAAHEAATRVNAVRDAHWVQKHPIDYA